MNQPKRDSLREQLKHCIGACMCSPKVEDCLYWDIPKTMGLDTPEHGELQVNKLFALFQQELEDIADQLEPDLFGHDWERLRQVIDAKIASLKGDK